jgi:LPXTG-motif cell wall-anchored protein
MVVATEAKDQIVYDGMPSLAVRAPARALTSLGEEDPAIPLAAPSVSPILKLAGVAALIAGGLYILKRKR